MLAHPNHSAGPPGCSPGQLQISHGHGGSPGMGRPSSAQGPGQGSLPRGLGSSLSSESTWHWRAGNRDGPSHGCQSR